MAKPSWCFDVIVMYFMPAAFAIATQDAGSYFTGLNAGGKSRSYSGTVMRFWCITHSPSPATE